MALTIKQKAFIDEYLKCRNAAEAARRAGYSERTARSIGAENLTKPDISREIKRVTKQKAMGRDEVLGLQADVARGTMEDFVSFNLNPYPAFTLDLGKARRRGVLHLVKKLKYNSDGLPEIELYDAADARKTIMKHLGLLKDQIEIDWRKEAEEQGINAGSLFEQLVNNYVAAIAASDGEDDSGSVDGG